jgi:hypothetical protein
VLRRVVLGFVLIAAVVAMHNVTPSTLPLRIDAGSHHTVLTAESSDDGHCSHHSHGSDGCDSMDGVHACEAVLPNPESGVAASPLTGWVEPTAVDRTIIFATDCGAYLRGPPARTGLSRAELSIWRL